MLSGTKVKLYPTKEQEADFAKLFGCARKVYNLSLAHAIAEYEEKKKSVANIKHLGYYFHNVLTKTEEFAYLNEHNTKVLKQPIRHLCTAFTNFFKSLKGKRKGKSGFPKFKSKHDKQKITFPEDAISVKPFGGKKMDRLNLTTTIKGLKFKCSPEDHRFLIENKGNIKSITITKSKAGTYHASILIDSPRGNQYRKAVYKTTDKTVGVDLGIKEFLVCSDTVVVENPRHLKKSTKKLKRKQRKLSKADIKNKNKRNEEFKLKNGRDIDPKVGNQVVQSNNRKKLVKQIAKDYEKVTNKRETFLHEKSTMLVKENQIICMEDLNVKGMMKNRKLAKAIQDVGLGKFKTMMNYKCAWKGRELVFVDRWYPSSKTCSCCGHKKEELSLSERVFICENCGLEIDRDYNASLNIEREGLRLLSERKNKEKIGSRGPELKLEDCQQIDGEIISPEGREYPNKGEDTRSDALINLDGFHKIQ